MMKPLLLSFTLLLPAALHAAEPAVRAGQAQTRQADKADKQAPRLSAGGKRLASKPAGAKAATARRSNAPASIAATPGQAVTANPRMDFLQQFADADDDGNGLLSRTEAERNLPAVAGKFDHADASSDGWLTPEELRNYLQASRRSEPHG